MPFSKTLSLPQTRVGAIIVSLAIALSALVVAPAASADPTTGSVTGVVSDPDGNPKAGLSSRLFEWNGSSWGAPTAFADTDVNGSYTFSTLSTGKRYTIMVSTFNGASTSTNLYRDGYLDGLTAMPSSSTGPGTFEFVGTNLTKNITLTYDKSVSGTVVDNVTGLGVAGAKVYISSWYTMTSTPYWNELLQLTTDANGVWKTVLYTTGSYTARVTKDTYAQTYLGGGTSLPESPTSPGTFEYQGVTTSVPTIRITSLTPVQTTPPTVATPLTPPVSVLPPAATDDEEDAEEVTETVVETPTVTTNSNSGTTTAGSTVATQTVITPATTTSGPDPVLATMKTAIPKITGKTKVGTVLKVTTGTWTAKTKFTYQWYANGKKIKKATMATYKPTKADEGKKLTLKVTGTKKGFTTTVKTIKVGTVKK
jgi:hypothetical protein